MDKSFWLAHRLRASARESERINTLAGAAEALPSALVHSLVAEGWSEIEAMQATIDLLNAQVRDLMRATV